MFRGLLNIFCSEFPDIPEKSWRRSGKPANAERFAFEANAIVDEFIMITVLKLHPWKHLTVQRQEQEQLKKM